MKADYASWKTSVHQNTGCIQCHVKPGLIHLLIDKAKSPKSLFYHLTGGYEKPINKESELASEISNESCLLCHTEGRDESLGHGLLFKHQAHLKIRMQCSECHNRVAHSIKGYENFLTMESCKERCHDGKALNNRCDFCHSQSFLLKASQKIKSNSSSN
jgi:nitrate/TMAO reductase-like tetraheme cytochrome c subunit